VGTDSGRTRPDRCAKGTSVIIGAAIGALMFHERFGRWRIISAILITGGVILISL
jgi:drug/metabolite transporter (DMT)-like permease